MPLIKAKTSPRGTKDPLFINGVKDLSIPRSTTNPCLLRAPKTSPC